MFLNISLLEWFGYLGSVIVAFSLTMSSIKKLRWYNLVGALVFTVYGFAIGAMPVGFLNLFIVLADIYYLSKMYSYKESFKAIVVPSTDSYMDYFIDFHKSEMLEFFPNFSKSDFNTHKENCFAFLLLRNAAVAGVFLGVKNNDKLTVVVDFVTAAYRDLKPGDFIYKTNLQLLLNEGITTIECSTSNKAHRKYLLKMGFELLDVNLEVLTLKISEK